MRETRFARNTLGAALKRADELKLNDWVLVPRWADGPELVRVFSLELQGDDVEVNGDLTTSEGNTFLVLPAPL